MQICSKPEIENCLSWSNPSFDVSTNDVNSALLVATTSQWMSPFERPVATALPTTLAPFFAVIVTSLALCVLKSRSVKTQPVGTLMVKLLMTPSLGALMSANPLANVDTTSVTKETGGVPASPGCDPICPVPAAVVPESK